MTSRGRLESGYGVAVTRSHADAAQCASFSFCGAQVAPVKYPPGCRSSVRHVLAVPSISLMLCLVQFPVGTVANSYRGVGATGFTYVVVEEYSQCACSFVVAELEFSDDS